MTMGPTETFSLMAEKYGGIDKTDNQAIEHFFEIVLPTFPPRIQQILVDEVFFLTTGLPPMYAKLEPAPKGTATKKPVGKRKAVKRSAQAEHDVFYIQREAAEVFGTESKANVWLTQPNQRLKNKTPLS